MLTLTRQEIRDLSQSVISPGLKHAPNVFAFTEQGVAMLSSVLNNPRAIKVNLEIMRAFVRLRGMMTSQKEVARKLVELEKHLQDHDEQIQTIFTAIRQLMAPKEAPKKRIGFQLKEKRAAYWAKG
jgi:hypothetical protein